MKKVLIIFGTRPEAIKMAPVVKSLKSRDDIFDARVCVTAQHREMLDQPLALFNIKPEYDLNIMKAGQDLYDITSAVLLKLRDIFKEFCPDIVLVHGDTTTTFSAALAAYYMKIPVGHVEAGLRTGDIYSPWPEEINRRLTGNIAKFNFAPTEKACENLKQENTAESTIYCTGNTVIDALLFMKEKLDTDKNFKQKTEKEINELFPVKFDGKTVLVTGHRRESFGQGFLNICEAIKDVALKYKDVRFVYPVHMNPNVTEPVNKILKGLENVFLINPVNYHQFIYLMDCSDIILTDSGGVQEEAPSLGKPVLVMRDTTERPEAVTAGVAKLVGTNKDVIVENLCILIENKEEYSKMADAKNPYGDGTSAEAIADILEKYL